MKLLELARRYTKLEKWDKKYLGLCPFHKEKTPSFTVDEKKQLFHCFGCGEGGDVLSFIMGKEKLNLKEAKNYLRNFEKAIR